jgi:thiol-disulfide isomerase/thioredoxin
VIRKVPVDLMEGTKRGSILSCVALIAILALFALETKAYFTKKLVADLALDRSDDPRIRLNFNITMLDLKCEWAVIDVVSALGTDQNVTAHVTKWDIDAEGVRKAYQGRNRNQKDLDLYDESVTETIDELHENGEQAISLDLETIQFAKNENSFLFVDFFASWCSHCRDLAPTWEKLAELMEDVAEKNGKQHPDDYTDADFDAATKVALPVAIAKVDCVSNTELCNQHENIRAYPTLRLFVDGQPWSGGDYMGHRTLLEMVEWLFFVEERTQGDESMRQLHLAHQAARERLDEGLASAEERKWHDNVLKNKKRLHHEWKHEEHPGCQIAGHLLLDRAPGNFHVQARSQHHDLAAHMTNLSHMVNELYIGDPTAKHWIEKKRSDLPDGIAIAPLDGNLYPTMNLHESYHHYLKLVSTRIEGMKVGSRELRSYQMLANSQLALYQYDVTPEAKFAYDLSPISVTYSFRTRHWYDYLTSIFAIVGGVFTVVGLIEGSINATVSTVKRRR